MIDTLKLGLTGLVSKLANAPALMTEDEDDTGKNGSAPLKEPPPETPSKDTSSVSPDDGRMPGEDVTKALAPEPEESNVDNTTNTAKTDATADASTNNATPPAPAAVTPPTADPAIPAPVANVTPPADPAVPPPATIAPIAPIAQPSLADVIGEMQKSMAATLKELTTSMAQSITDALKTAFAGAPAPTIVPGGVVKSEQAAPASPAAAVLEPTVVNKQQGMDWPEDFNAARRAKA